MKRFMYILYLLQWHLTHFGKGYKGMEPSCFEEWIDNEYSEVDYEKK